MRSGSPTTLHYWRSNKCYFSNKTTYKLQFPVRPGVLVWFVYLVSAKTSTRDVVHKYVVTRVIKVCYSVPLSSPPTHDILIMPRKLPGRTGTRSCAEQGIRSLGQTAGVLLRQPLASSFAIDMGVSYYALSGRNGSLHLLLSVHLFGIIAA